MGLFGRTPPAPPPELVSRVADLESTVRMLRLEQAEITDKVYRWMKRAEARVRSDAEPSANGAKAEQRPAYSDNPRVQRLIERRMRHGLLHPDGRSVGEGSEAP